MLRSWTELKGHQEQRELFMRSLSQNRLSHAYVLCGPEGIGKRQFARLMAKSLFCREHKAEELDACGTCRACRSFEAGTWPDFLEISRPEGKSQIPIDLLIGSPDNRGREGMCYELAMAPQASTRRIAIIDDAQYLNADGANALLKTLEEPPSDALIMLIVNNADTLLPTIRSRCQVVRFFPLTEQEIADILLIEKLVESESEAQLIAEMAEGSLVVAGQLLNPDLRKLKDSISEQLNLLEKMQPLVLAKQIADDLDRISSGGEEQRRNALWLMRFVADFIRHRMRLLVEGDFSDPLTKRFGVRSGIDLLAPMLDRVVQAGQQVEGNSPVRLVLEALFDDLARQIRIGPITAR